MNIRILLASLLAVCCTGLAQAGKADAGTIQSIYFMKEGVAIFHTNGTHHNPPGCGVNLKGRWAFEITSEAGKARLAGLLSAFSLGKRIEILGEGNCSAWGDTESVYYFTIVQ